MVPKVVERLKSLLRSRKLAAALLLLCLASGVALAFVLWPEREPFHQGVSASDWLEAASTNGAKVLPATEAFKAMGPEGATFLGNELLRKPSAVDDWLLAHHQKIPARLKPTLLKPHRPVVNETVLSILDKMETNASPAIPMLITWLENSTNVSGGISASQAKIIVRSHTYSLAHLQMGGSNILISLPSVGPKALMTVTQVSVAQNGIVGTNVFYKIRYNSNAIPYTAHRILTNLGSSDPRVIDILLRPFEPAPRGLPSFGNNLKSAALQQIPLLMKTAERGAPKERETALALLKLTQPESAPARDFLIHRLEQNDPHSRSIIVSALEDATGTQDLGRIVPIAIKSLERHSPLNNKTNPEALFPSLKKMSAHSPLVTSGLQEVLLKTSIPDRARVLQLLGEIGSIANVDTNVLKICTTHHDATVRTKAWSALAAITGSMEAKVNEQITLIDYGLDEAVLRACVALATWGPGAAQARDALRPCLRHANERIIAAAARALGSIGEAARDSVADLEPLQNHPRPEIQEAAREAIQKIVNAPAGGRN